MKIHFTKILAFLALMLFNLELSAQYFPASDSTNVQVQENKKNKASRNLNTKSFWDDVYFGGNFGLSFGNQATSVLVEPLAGYNFTERFSGGLGISYQYYSYKDYFGVKQESNIYGGKIFSRYRVLENIFVHGEFENLSYQRVISRDSTGKYEYLREWIPGLFFGGGFFQPFGKKGGMSLMVLYNVLYDENTSPYPEPYVIRAGFTF
ncbi:hypothetical protein [Aureibacter tunicatorum]|uniref:Outer membrane protein beta-barrel domain-containing protein n=1 Tax=Aureibacter tunicatorum TaxID=866807 RepID=A0AAE3XJW8_9BACT|nr:hypothetical protein [Aureibacter tunicatorum]MDR6237993.1 hypothetical protein [Aureibacter tunicatorum]